jgi:hypothetical protein
MKTIRIILSLAIVIVLLGTCKKDPYDRKKYEGHYVGVMVPSLYYNVPNGDGQPVDLQLTKHKSIDNALVLKCSSNPPIVGSTHFGTSGFGSFDTEEQDYNNTVYVSDEDFLYQKGILSWDVGKLCRYVEPDSLYCLVTFSYPQPNGTDFVQEFFIKAKKTD